MRYYLLTEDQELVRVGMMEWAHAFESRNRSVGSTIVGAAHISTVFMGLDHRWTFEDDYHNPPIVFETMVLGGKDDGFQLRCCTYEQALKMHEAVVRYVKRRWYKPWTWAHYLPPETDYDTGELL